MPSAPLCIFVSGTGTDVGKTVLTAAVAAGLTERGLRVTYWKPVQTGAPDSDAERVRAYLGDQVTIAPTTFSFALPASPDQAAAAAGVEGPQVKELLAALQVLDGDVVLIEGAGGLLVPLNEDGETWSDFIHRADLPVLIAASTSLGTLNHTGLTIRHLQATGCTALAVVLSGPPAPAQVASLRRLYPEVALHELPLLPSWGRGTPPDADECEASLEAATFCLAHLAPHPNADHCAPWLRAAAAHVWYPYTQHKTALPPAPVVRARGVWLTLASGERLLDAVSSWWVNTIGHGRPEIAAAIARQQQSVDHVLFAGLVHAPAAELAARVTAMAGHGLTRAFFSDNGSTALEIALKMAVQSFANRGEPQRSTFLSFSGSYHGDTFGAMSVAQAPGFHGVFKPMLFKTLCAEPVTTHPSAVCPRGMAVLAERLASLAALLKAEHSTLAGVVVEPLLQGAGGMLVQPVEFLQGVAALCRQYHLPLILDEVFTGLGRVGTAFAFQRAGIEPDIVAMAKGLTGGNLPLALTLAREDFFSAFLSDDRGQALMHGHSYTANPIACAAALATLSIYDREDLAGRARAMEARCGEWLATRGLLLKVQNPRTIGGVMAFELPGTALTDYYHPRAAEVAGVAREHGLFLRPLGNTVYLAPPLTIAAAELEWALQQLELVLAACSG